MMPAYSGLLASVTSRSGTTPSGAPENLSTSFYGGTKVLLHWTSGSAGDGTKIYKNGTQVANYAAGGTRHYTDEYYWNYNAETWTAKHVSAVGQLSAAATFPPAGTVGGFDPSGNDSGGNGSGGSGSSGNGRF